MPRPVLRFPTVKTRISQPLLAHAFAHRAFVRGHWWGFGVHHVPGDVEIVMGMTGKTKIEVSAPYGHGGFPPWGYAVSNADDHRAAYEYEISPEAKAWYRLRAAECDLADFERRGGSLAGLE